MNWNSSLKSKAGGSEAEIAGRESLAMAMKVSGEENPAVADALRELGVVLEKQGKLAEAEPMLRKALAMETKLIGRENDLVAWNLKDIAEVLVRKKDKLAEANKTIEKHWQSRERCMTTRVPSWRRRSIR